MMGGSLNIVMYHYVREIEGSAYPNIKGLDIAGFKRQLDYFSINFSMITAEQLLSFAIGEEKKLPLNACLLTFDDGFKDHIQYVLPELKLRNLQGSFFPPARPIIKKEILDVHAIHFILASANDSKALVKDLHTECLANGITQKKFTSLWTELAKPNRFDSPEVIFVKRMLQRNLPESIRNKITNNLFEKYVGKTESEFCNELYMSKKDIETMVCEGMYIGSHTYNHYFLNSVDKLAQENEIDKSIDFLGSVGAPIENWIMCYPYGAYNADTLSILKRKNCSVGLTTNVGAVSLYSDNLLELNRFDTNNFPQ